MNRFDDMNAALEDARQLMAACDRQADRMARLLLQYGRLRTLPHHRLVALKRELSGYNLKARQWK